MKDFRGNELQKGDLVYVASADVAAQPLLEHCVITDVVTHKKNGEPRKLPKLMLRPVGDLGAKPKGMAEGSVRKRVVKS